MPRYVTVIALLLSVGTVEGLHECAPPPLRLTIACGSDEESYQPIARSSEVFDASHLDSFCAMIHRAIPKAVENGKFIPAEPEYDQSAYADSLAPVAISPPKGFIPNLGLNRLKMPKLGIPKINVPKLKPSLRKLSPAPSVGSPMAFSSLKLKIEEESSAEKMEKFKRESRSCCTSLKCSDK